MALTLEAKPVPLQAWDGGSVRVGGTRVRLDTVLEGLAAVLALDP